MALFPSNECLSREQIGPGNSGHNDETVGWTADMEHHLCSLACPGHFVFAALARICALAQRISPAAAMRIYLSGIFQKHISEISRLVLVLGLSREPGKLLQCRPGKLPLWRLGWVGK